MPCRRFFVLPDLDLGFGDELSSLSFLHVSEAALAQQLVDDGTAHVHAASGFGRLDQLFLGLLGCGCERS
jgi:hypothetical protein